MNNELLFLLHLSLLLGATYGAFLTSRPLLQGLICLQVVCANIFVVRQMSLFGLTACGGGMYIVSSILGLLLLQTFHCKRVAHRTLYLSFGMALFFLLLTQFQLWYAPAAVDYGHAHFVALLGRVPRITAASLCAHFIAHYVTLTLHQVLRSLCSGHGLFIITTATIIFGQVLDSLIFFTGSFHGFAPWPQIVQMVTVSMGIKTVMVLCSSGLLSLAKRLHKEERP